MGSAGLVFWRSGVLRRLQAGDKADRGLFGEPLLMASRGGGVTVAAGGSGSKVTANAEGNRSDDGGGGMSTWAPETSI